MDLARRGHCDIGTNSECPPRIPNDYVRKIERGREMLVELLLATIMVVVIVLTHLVGLGLLVRLLQSHTRLFRKLRIMPLTLLIAATIGIITIHSIEIWIYAGLYLALHAFGSFEEALYFSTVTFASIGYGDLLMPKPWRILAAIEGAAGVIMLGWSTAFLVSLLAQLKMFRHDWLSWEHAPA